MALKFVSKQSLRRGVLSFRRLKLKAGPNIVSLDGFELISHFQSDNCQIMQLPSIKKRGFPKMTFKPCDLPRSKVSKARQDFSTPPKGLHESVYVL